MSQFTWKQLLDGYACTECGRCNSVCPALATDKPLWPKEIILGVKEELFADRPPATGRATRERASETARHEPLVGGRIKEESLWACTNCGACVEICPVNIEHVQKIDDMRRHLVMEESSFPQEVTPLFNNLERNGNPWEISNDTRAEWAQALGVKTLAEDPDVEVLYWVGCMGSFDARNRKVATAFAKVMKPRTCASASWGRRRTAPATRRGASATSTSGRRWPSRTSRRSTATASARPRR